MVIVCIYSEEKEQDKAKDCRNGGKMGNWEVATCQHVMKVWGGSGGLGWGFYFLSFPLSEEK